MQQAEYFINSNRVAHDTSHKTREALTMAIANMHRWIILISAAYLLILNLLIN